MTVNTKKVAGRRDVRYESFDDLLADAERLAGGSAQTVGNWTVGQILRHLALSIDSSVDGTDMKIPWLMKKAFMLVMNKEKLMKNPLSPGFKIPKSGQAQFNPDPATTTQEGLARLRAAVERYTTETSLAEHVAFGKLSREEWDQFNLRHAEMHLSFAVPK